MRKSSIIMTKFISGIEINRSFFEEVVRPLLQEVYPDIQYSAALIGPGSETLRFDTEMSMDHDWGYRFSIFLGEGFEGLVDDIANLLSYRLPSSYAGFAVSLPPTSKSPVFLSRQRSLDGPIKHHITVSTVRNFMLRQVGYHTPKTWHAAEWLTIPSHAIGEVIAGEVYLDGTGELTALRADLSWYPNDIWLYMMASAWQRIGQEEHLMPRAGYVGDELGSAIIGSRLVRDVMNLGFLLEKKYAPYAKWYGTAFQRLTCARELSPLLMKAQQAVMWRERENALCGAYEILAQMHNNLNIGRKLPTSASAFFDRPFQIIHGGDFAQALVEQITDFEMRDIASRLLIGNVSQWSDNTDIANVNKKELKGLYS